MRRTAVPTFFAIAAVWACGSIGSPDGASSGATAASSQTSPIATPSSAPNAFQPGDCTYPAIGGTPTQPAHDTFRTVIAVPQGWTQIDTSGFDATVFKLAAPPTYQNSPTTIQIVSAFDDVPHHSPTEYLTGQTQGYVTIVGGIQTCSVNGDSGAFAQYTHRANAGYWVLWIHLAVVYELILEGNGGVDPRAIGGAKGVLASLRWTSNTPPPQYTPS
jgi:hypothetical protein